MNLLSAVVAVVVVVSGVDHPNVVVVVVVVVRKQRGTGAALERRKKKKKKKRVLLFSKLERESFLFGDAQIPNPREHHHWKKMTTDRKYVRALVSSIASLFCRRRCLEARIGAIGFRSSRLVPSFFSARRVSTRERER